MKNLKKATIKEGIMLSIDYEELFLTKGMKVEMTYIDDETEKNETIVGKISYADDYNLELDDNGKFIEFNDIIEIDEY